MAVFGFGRRNAVGRQYNGGNVSVMLPRYTTPPERNTRDWLEMFGRNPRLAVVDRIASDLSTCAGKLYRKDENGEEVEITDHPFLNFMAHPNPLYEMTSGACWRLQQIYLELKGEGYFVYEFDALGRPVELWPLPTHWVQQTPYVGYPYYEIRTTGGLIRQIPVDDIFCIEDLRDHNDDWYFILTDVTDPVCVTALCKWAESTEPTEAALGAGVEDHRKFYFGQTNDKEYVNEYGRSVVTYADNLAEWADAAWVGSVGPFWPESVTWKWKVPDGVSVADLRDSERDLLEENRVNFMTAEYKHEYMKNGICGDGNFIDNVLGADYITHQIRENLYEIFIANKKIAYTDDGFALVAAGVFAALNRAVELHIIATDPEDDTGVYTVVIPKRADATDEQARNRQMPDIKWSAQLEGAVHSVKVNGTLRVTLNG